MTSMFDTPSPIIARLEAIEQDLAVRGPALEAAARSWYLAKRDKERERALKFIAATGTVAERSAVADRDTALMGKQEEAEYEALKAVVRTLETRASIGQSLLRTHGRIS